MEALWFSSRIIGFVQEVLDILGKLDFLAKRKPCTHAHICPNIVQAKGDGDMGVCVFSKMNMRKTFGCLSTLHHLHNKHTIKTPTTTKWKGCTPNTPATRAHIICMHGCTTEYQTNENQSANIIGNHRTSTKHTLTQTNMWSNVWTSGVRALNGGLLCFKKTYIYTYI